MIFQSHKVFNEILYLPACRLTGYILAVGGRWRKRASAGDALTAGSSNLRFSVVDLTPGDGHAAGFTVGKVNTDLDMWFRPRDWSLPRVGARYSVGAGPHTLAHHMQDAYADITLGASLGTTEVRYRAETLNPTSAYIDASYKQTIVLKLAAHSLLTLSGTAYTSFSNPLPGATTPFSSFYITLGGEGPGASQSSFSIRKDQPWLEYDRSEHFQLAYANPSDHDITVNLSLEGTVHASPVPEPTTYAMLGAGLALLGLTVRRRQHRHAA
ncbi:PEP-CTERM sorting domain-containing protein [Massilia sp. BJB1822]|uniref:PEP-CTERM sorting domain-containing protein n=1 Tax=Massilia sp. BJB1822 TaxID=2744470 RepID=UPI001E4E3FE9|nr:PEP-CTERM sorting domain-containing protein [Massilia sp. BJB1822]